MCPNEESICPTINVAPFLMWAYNVGVGGRGTFTPGMSSRISTEIHAILQQIGQAMKKRSWKVSSCHEGFLKTAYIHVCWSDRKNESKLNFIWCRGTTNYYKKKKKEAVMDHMMLIPLRGLIYLWLLHW